MQMANTSDRMTTTRARTQRRLINHIQAATCEDCLPSCTRGRRLKQEKPEAIYYLGQVGENLYLIIILFLKVRNSGATKEQRVHSGNVKHLLAEEDACRVIKK